ncbi:MAG: AMP-binding protein, partial [Chlamydiia bacterium]|nr:AMP-binding protein [Chlamydiia bacterium]
LPNHPAHMDPLFLFLLLWPHYRMRPIVVEYIFRLSILKPFMRLVRAISVPSFDSSVNPLKVKRAEQAVEAIASGLKKGENFILYPAGKLKHSGREMLGGASGAHSLFQQCSDVQVVLIRTTGLWGSSFSRALLGKSPDLPSTLFHGLKVLLKNGIFFTPRRSVEIEICPEPSDFPKKAGRLAFNRYLENWFNRYHTQEGKLVDIEPATLVSYSFWKQEVPTLFQPKIKKIQGLMEVSKETRMKVYGEIRKILGSPEISITPEMHLATDLGMDSLNLAELSAFLLKSYQAEEVHPEDLQTVQNVLEIAEGCRLSESPTREASQIKWPDHECKRRRMPVAPEGKTIPEAFLNACLRMGGHIACGDDLVGTMSYRRIKRAALVLSLYFKQCPESHIGIMLPALSVTYIVILAILFAGKVPVMLNWTLGPRYLDEMLRAGEIQRVISSWRFLDRLSHVDLGGVADRLEFLEEIRSKISFFKKLKGLWLSFLSVPSTLRALHLDQMSGEEKAVILFTSGTESNPKGVPLSHRNILANQRSAMQCLTLRADDVIYGILPPFHSFGFSVCGLFPLCGGIRVAFYPDPTDAVALAEGIERWQITLFCSPPSFLKAVFSVAKEAQFRSIRYFVCGAEKTPNELIERVKRLEIDAKIIEGYGITECSPILTLTRPNLPHIGVGQPLPDISIRMIHPETSKPLPDSVDGEICVRGPNVFQGYLDPRTKDPFIVIDQQQWYRTGDIGHFDEHHNLILSGRLKRFTKLGGEMISLGAIEEALVTQLAKMGRILDELPSLALIADERLEEKPQLILFSTLFLEKDEANEILREAGFSRLAKIASVRRIEEIPLMGTGKTDYRRLYSYLQENT